MAHKVTKMHRIQNQIIFLNLIKSIIQYILKYICITLKPFHILHFSGSYLNSVSFRWDLISSSVFVTSSFFTPTHINDDG